MGEGREGGGTGEMRVDERRGAKKKKSLYLNSGAVTCERRAAEGNP